LNVVINKTGKQIMADKAQKSSKELSGAKDQKSAEPVALEQAPEVTDVNRQRFDWRSLNTLAVVSLSTALTSVGAVAAIITGHIALAQIKRSDQNGRKLAITGVTIGYVHNRIMDPFWDHCFFANGIYGVWIIRSTAF